MVELKTEDIGVDQIITVLRNNRVPEDHSWVGELLRVRAVDLPFIVVSEDGKNRGFSLRADDYTFGNMSMEYKLALTKGPPKQ